MRNLKRALSLALALVMVLSMMVVGAGAVSVDDFSDGADIVNKEAVTVLATLNVINGKEDGSYDPTGTITRGEMAKMICVILNGGNDPVLGETVADSYSDTASHWAKAYIEYCTTLGIVAGKGDGTFDPNGQVTVAEAAKMVLVALGYNAGVEGYTGGNWQINTDVRANALGLYNDLDYSTTSAALTRDNAAQMLYNALDCNMVMYDYIITGTVDNAITTKPQLNDWDLGTLLWEKFKAVKLEGVVVANEYADLDSTREDAEKAPAGTVIGSHLDAGKTQILVTNYDVDGDQPVFRNTNYTFNVTTGENELAKTVYMFVKPYTSTSDNANRATVIGSAIVSDDNTIVTDASGDSVTDVADDNGLDLVADTQYIYNYAEMGSSIPTAVDAMTGIQKTLIDTDADGDVNYVLYKEMGLGKVTLYSTAKDGQIVVAIDNGNYVNKDSADVVGFEDVEKDAYVLTAYIGGRLYVQTAETVTGTIEAYKQTDGATKGTYRITGFTIDGTAYDVSRVFTYDGDITAAVDEVDKTILESDATFYLDENGYVVAYGEVDETAYKYAYVWGAEAGGSIDTDRVKVTLEDGTTKTYDLNDNSDVDVVTGSSNAAGTVMNEGDMQGKVYAYSITSGGEIKLTMPAGGAVSASKPIFTKGLTNIRFDGGATGTEVGVLTPSDIKAADIETKTYYSNNATTFFYVSYKSTGAIDKVDVYNGRNEAPTVEGDQGTAILALNARGTVASAVFDNVNVAESAGDHVFIYDAGYVWSDYGYVDAYFNGEDTAQEDVRVAYVDQLGGEIEHNPTVEDGIYLYRENSDGYYEITDPDGEEYFFEGEVTRVNKANNTFVIEIDDEFYHEFRLTDDSVVVDYDSSHSSPVAYMGGTVSEGDVVEIIVNNADDSEVLMAAIMDRVDSTTGGGNNTPGGDAGDYFQTATYNNKTGEIELRYYDDTLTIDEILESASTEMDMSFTRVRNRDEGVGCTVVTADGEEYDCVEIEMFRISYNGETVDYVDNGSKDVLTATASDALRTAATGDVVVVDNTSGDDVFTGMDSWISTYTAGDEKFTINCNGVGDDITFVDAYKVSVDTGVTVTPAVNDGEYVVAGTEVELESTSGNPVMVRDADGKVSYVDSGDTYKVEGPVALADNAVTVDHATDVGSLTDKSDVQKDETYVGTGSELVDILGKTDITKLNNQNLVFGYVVDEADAGTGKTIQFELKDSSDTTVYSEKYTGVEVKAGAGFFYIDITEGQYNSSNTGAGGAATVSGGANTWDNGALADHGTGYYTWTVSDGTGTTFGSGYFVIE